MAVTGSKEPLFSWRRCCFLLLGILGFIFIYSASHGIRSPSSLTSGLQHPPPSYKSQSLSYDFGNASAYNELTDGLTSEECSFHFPDLYKEIDRAVAYWKEQNHTISALDHALNPDKKGSMRILFHENHMRILESIDAFFLGFRSMGTLSLFQRALDSANMAGELLPTVEIRLNFVDDADPAEGVTTTIWSTARNIHKDPHQRIWLIPNFDFWFSPPSGSFDEAKRLAMQYDNNSFAEKIPKLVWRGFAGFNEIRRSLLKVVQGKDDIFDVIGITGHDDEDEKPGHKLEEYHYCAYAMTLYTEGVSFSGRLKFLMNCRSLLFVPEIEWLVHYDHLLKMDGPDQNCVGVKRDLSDLETKVRYYLSHPEEADRIIDNMLATFRSRYTTRAATSCYTRRLIQAYASVSNPPEVLHPLSGGEVLGPRGRSFERFMMKPIDGDFDYEDGIGLSR